uniref:Cytochrome c6 n=1 Tax=Sebdenia flabellata TaxID=42024 RepID=A0A1C9CA03_9FLOR|nr:cytochrome c553 [Sebdenia flabellata]AOM65207.1 cytochrome c553 [Sebdenia flabellata]
MRLLITLFVLSSALLINNTEKVFAGDLESGEEIFTANCSACHVGGNNVLMPEKTLKKDVLHDNAMDSISAITTQVKNGKNAMPSFGARLADEEIEQVAQYVLAQSENGW